MNPVDHEINGAELLHKRVTKTRFRRSIFEAWGSRCCYCGGTADTLDHIHPRVKGGLTVKHNLVPACAPCNRRKGHQDVFGWWRREPGWNLLEQQRLINWITRDGR